MYHSWWISYPCHHIKKSKLECNWYNINPIDENDSILTYICKLVISLNCHICKMLVVNCRVHLLSMSYVKSCVGLCQEIWDHILRPIDFHMCGHPYCRESWLTPICAHRFDLSIWSTPKHWPDGKGFRGLHTSKMVVWTRSFRLAMLPLTLIRCFLQEGTSVTFQPLL